MEPRRPHYLLCSQTDPRAEPGVWKVVLKAADGAVLFEASDSEPETSGERLELLAVVRGLEAIDCPAVVTLVTPSRYVRRGLAYGLEEWRANGWSWEWYGRMAPVKNGDLWQRLDQALRFHEVECRRWRVDSAHAGQQRPKREDSTALAPQRLGSNRSNSFEAATSQAALERPERQKTRRNSPPLPRPRPRQVREDSDASCGWVNTLICHLAMFLWRLGGGPALAPAGRMPSGASE